VRQLRATHALAGVRRRRRLLRIPVEAVSPEHPQRAIPVHQHSRRRVAISTLLDKVVTKYLGPTAALDENLAGDQVQLVVAIKTYFGTELHGEQPGVLIFVVHCAYGVVQRMQAESIPMMLGKKLPLSTDASPPKTPTQRYSLILKMLRIHRHLMVLCSTSPSDLFWAELRTTRQRFGKK
jgi:hypothetical protein